MPLIRPGMRKPPPGFDRIAEKLEAFMDYMKDATQEDSRGVVGQTKKAAGHKRPREASHDDDADAAPTLTSSDAVLNSTEAHVEATHADGAGVEEEAKPIPPLWRLAQINRDRTRFVVDACFRTKEISKEVFDYCCEMQFIDAGLARRWSLPGYERLCCTACGVPGSAAIAATVASRFAYRDKNDMKDRKSAAARHADRATCVCRVPASQRRDRSFHACAVCGCQGCCSADAKVTRDDAQEDE